MAELPARIELITRPTTDPNEVAVSLPTSRTLLTQGDTFFVEVWAQTSNANGLSSVSVDISFSAEFASAVTLTHSMLFSQLTNGVMNNTSGLIDNLSGSHLSSCNDQIAVAPTWARVATIEMVADLEGTIDLVAGPTGAAAFGTAICGVGDLLPADIQFGSISLLVVQPGVPTTSQWGVIAMALIMLIVATLFRPRLRRLALARTSKSTHFRG